jgi:hypothetical protein
MNAIVGRNREQAEAYAAQMSELNTVKASMEAAFAKALRRDIHPNPRITGARAHAIDIANYDLARGIAEMRKLVRVFGRYYAASEADHQNMVINGVIDLYGDRPARATAVTERAFDPVEQTRSYVANLGRRGITLRLELNGDIVAEPPHLVTDADRAEIARREEVIGRILRNTHRV